MLLGFNLRFQIKFLIQGVPSESVLSTFWSLSKNISGVLESVAGNLVPGQS